MISVISKRTFDNIFPWIDDSEFNPSKLTENKNDIYIINDIAKYSSSNQERIFFANGIVIKKDDNYYVITNYHTVTHCDSVNINIKVVDINKTSKIINIEIKKLLDFYDFDLSLYVIPLKNIPESYTIESYYNFDNLSCSMSYVVDDIISNNYKSISYNFVIDYCIKNSSSILINSLACRILNIKTFNTHNNKVMIPMYFVNLEKSTNNLNGLSGGILYSKNKKDIIGIVSMEIVDDKSNHTIIVLPTYLMKGVINIYENRQIFYYTCQYVMANIKISQNTQEDEKKIESVNTIKILKDTNNNTINVKTNKPFNFKNKLICDFDNKSFTSKGMIYSDILKIDCTINNYILIKSIIDKNSLDNIAIKYYSLLSKNNKLMTKYIKLNQYNYDTYHNNQIYDRQAVIIKGLLFINLNLEFVNNLEKQKKIKINSSCLQKIYNIITCEKVIILADILYNIIRKKTQKKYKLLNLPFLVDKTTDEKLLLCLNKIDNIPVTTLLEMNKVISQNKIKNIQLKVLQLENTKKSSDTLENTIDIIF